MKKYPNKTSCFSNYLLLNTCNVLRLNIFIIPCLVIENSFKEIDVVLLFVNLTSSLNSLPVKTKLWFAYIYFSSTVSLVATVIILIVAVEQTS